MRKTWRYTTIGLILLIATAVVATAACAAPTPTPTPPPKATPAPPPIGMLIGERYHDIHINKLQVKCETCHTKAVETYNDPLAQASNLADRRACLSCHKEDTAQPFYGEAWSKAKVR